MIRRCIKFIFAAAALLQLPAMAADAPTEPVYIEADRVEIYDREQKSIYSGNVTLTHGAVHMSADDVTVYGHDKQLSRVEAVGRPVTYHQALEGKPVTKAQARRMEYGVEDGKMILLGEAMLWQNGNEFRGDRIVYDSRQEVVSATKSEQGEGRVRVILHPEERTQVPGGEQAPDEPLPSEPLQ